jgi:predicted ATPase
MVTLLGMGGVGKTRLALQAAADLAGHFADGVAVVALATINDTAYLVTTIANTVGCALSGTSQAEATLIDFLRPRTQLLILDNLEQLLGAGQEEQFSALINGILQAAPGVRVLCTSRERLRLRDEWVIVVEGLDIPDDRPGVRIERSPAVVLFLERARQVAGKFVLTAQNRSAIARICRSLGGVPLAIELAASWVLVLSCEEIATEVARSTDVLSVSHRDLPPRHQSLRAVLDHSWHLLAPDERHVLAHLSLFVGGCRREAAMAVLDERISIARLLSLLAALVDKSLVRRLTDADGSTRYDLHLFVRQYAGERLAEMGAKEVAARHAAYYGTWLAEQDEILKSARQKTAVTAITTEIANIRSAWHWGCQNQDAPLLRTIAWTLFWFYEIRGWYTESAELWVHGVNALHEHAVRSDAPKHVQAAYALLVAFKGAASARRDPAYGREHMFAGMTMLRTLSDYPALIFTMTCAYLFIFTGEYSKAEALSDEAIGLVEAHQHDWLRTISRIVRGVLEVFRSEPGEARPHLQKALEAAHTVGDPRFIMMSMINLGLIDLGLGAVEQAEQQFREVHLRAAEHQDRFQMSQVLQALGRVARIKNDHAEAEWLFNESLVIAREISDHWLEAQALGCLATLANGQSNMTRARQLHRDAVRASARAPLQIALDELAALALFELDVSAKAALTVLAYVRAHPLARPVTRATAASRWAEATRCIATSKVQEAEAAAQQFPADQPAMLLSLFPTS